MLLTVSLTNVANVNDPLSKMPLLQPLLDLGANIGLPKQQKILVKIIDKCGGNKADKLCKITLLRCMISNGR
jgi:hypothetical protein